MIRDGSSPDPRVALGKLSPMLPDPWGTWGSYVIGVRRLLMLAV